MEEGMLTLELIVSDTAPQLLATLVRNKNLSGS